MCWAFKEDLEGKNQKTKNKTQTKILTLCLSLGKDMEEVGPEKKDSSQRSQETTETQFQKWARGDVHLWLRIPGRGAAWGTLGSTGIHRLSGESCLE